MFPFSCCFSDCMEPELSMGQSTSNRSSQHYHQRYSQQHNTGFYQQQYPRTQQQPFHQQPNYQQQYYQQQQRPTQPPFIEQFFAPFFGQPNSYQQPHYQQPFHQQSNYQRHYQQPNYQQPFFEFDPTTFFNTFFSTQHQQPFRPYPNRQQQQHRPQQRPVDDDKPQPTSQKALSQLPIFYLFDSKLDLLKQTLSENPDATTCTICQDEFQVMQKVIMLPCQHLFHYPCVEPWLKKNNSCPNCRFELPVDDPRREALRKQRMEQQFTRKGLQLMMLGMQVERVFIKVQDVIVKFENNANYKKEILLKELNSCSIELDNLLTKLDGLGELKVERVRKQRKELVLKVQMIEKCIEKWTKRIKECCS